MKQPRLLLAASAGLAFALAACADDETEQVDVAAVEADQTALAEEYDPMARDYTLDADAQERRSQFDEAAFQEEYRGYRDDIVGEQVSLTGGGGDTTDAEAEAAAQPRDPATNMRSRQNMTWSYLDRNSDGQLSVGEYAIWAIPLDPTQPAPNDETQPFLTSDEANKAADSFFYYDQDGDTYLSQQEFSVARRGDTLA